MIEILMNFYIGIISLIIIALFVWGIWGIIAFIFQRKADKYFERMEEIE